MPYIKQSRRQSLARGGIFLSPGDLNYRITLVILAYLGEKGLWYQTINDILGALEGAKLEFYRRVVVDYEQGKLKENGDVYPSQQNNSMETKEPGKSP